MNTQFPPVDSATAALIEQADIAAKQGDYMQAGALYEAALAEDPTQISLYWHLGVALALQGQEAEAQVAWMTPLLEAEPEQAEQWTTELVEIVIAAADQQEANGNREPAWLLRQHLREFAPENIDNLLSLVRLSLLTQVFSFKDELLDQAIAGLSEFDPATQTFAADRLIQTVALLLEIAPGHPNTLAFLEACLPHVTQPQLAQQFTEVLLARTRKFRSRADDRIAIELGLLCIKLLPNDLKVLSTTISLLQNGPPDCLLKSIELAERYVSVATHLLDRILATDSLLACWMYCGGDWQRTIEIAHDLELLMVELLNTYDSMVQSADGNARSELPPELGFLTNVLAVTPQFLYIDDAPASYRPVRNRLGEIGQTHIRSVLQEETDRYRQRQQQVRQSAARTRTPRIGYLSSGLQQHSVGWLARWLLKHHDRNRFDIHLYCSRQSPDFVQQDLMNIYGDRFHLVSSVIGQIADRIDQDEIDILVELDSLTSFGGCGVVALKPAPIQIHWLGYDASGIPAVDYFIADPYVLPDDAETYYSEKIWRLPQTYIAVDGFEVHMPSLRRDHLNIPGDAVVFLSSQTGMKRNPENARLQMRVIKEVPNSYFLVKSFKANPEFIQNFFIELAESEGVSADRLRFLPDVNSEFTHRANLGLADVVLDTFPYNGATTTLEALWMGLPIVTRVGQQFAARNSYTMLKNVGIQEGIAWSDAEYLEWGIRLGQDAALRERIFYQLQQSRHSAPLWNARQFTREVEQAYEQMWALYTGTL